jgi:RNA polymerase sigma factor (sigma-70 family)
MAARLATVRREPEDDYGQLADDGLVVLAKDGDHEAFGELVRRHRRMALRTAASVAGQDRAEDVVQDALILSFQALPTLQDSRRFPQWLGTIARFRALRVARVEGRRANRRVPFDEARVEETVSCAEEVDETELPRLEAALSRIPGPFEQVLRLHFFEGVPHQVIAERLGVSLSTSKWRCFRGKRGDRPRVRQRPRPAGPFLHELSRGPPEGLCGRGPANFRRACDSLELAEGAGRLEPDRDAAGHVAPVEDRKGGQVNSRSRSILPRSAGGLLLVASLAALPLLAIKPSGATGATDQPPAPPRFSRVVTRVDVPSVAVVDQDGRTVSLPEVLDSREPVVVNFFFASCGSICPVMTATLSRMREELGRQGRSVKTVSITIDPDQDTSDVLKAYAKRFSAGPGWTFLTGEPAAIASVQKAFGAETGGKFNHRALFFFRAARSDSWVRVEGLAGASDLAAEARGVMAAAVAGR